MTREQYETLVRNLRTQDTAATAHPLYVMQERIVEVGFDPAYSEDELLWIDTTSGDSELYATAKEATEAFFESLDGIKIEEERACGKRLDLIRLGDEEFLLDHGYEQTGYKIRWEFVSAHLTMAAAQQYIAENSHRCHDSCALELDGTKREMRVYVESAHRCPEMIAVIEALRSGMLVLMENVTEALSEVERLGLVTLHPAVETMQRLMGAAEEALERQQRDALVAAAAEAVETFGEDALEEHAAKLRAEGKL
jgi:hypothetical protein